MHVMRTSKALTYNFYNSIWFNYVICLIGTVFMSMGEGAYLFQIVPYLEMQNAGAFDIGITNGILSTVEAIACLLIGFLYKNKRTKLYLIIGILCVQASALILALQPTGWPVKTASGINGFGIGILLVLIHSTLLANRPSKVSLGLTVGIYTSGIAAGNAIGAALSGLIVDTYGFTYGFLYCFFAFFILMIAVLLIRMSLSQFEKQSPHPTAPDGLEPVEAAKTTKQPWIWKASLIAAFSMACVVIVSEVIFPIYALRSGLSVSFLGSLQGVKMMLAAVIRPFSGLMLAYVGSALLTSISLFVLTFAVICLPFVGLGAGLVLMSSLIGLSFGTCRVTSATLSVEHVNSNAENSRRIGLYSFALSFGQIITPFLGGWTADTISLTHTIVGLPLFFLVLYGIGLLYLWRKNTIHA